MSSRVQSFAPLVTAQSRVLVLGSMPGVESLNAKQYYAHPRNAFWRIMAELLQFSVALGYEARCEALMDSGVGLWDSVRECERPGSLDSAVVDATIEANDFASLFARHGQLRLGGAAARWRLCKRVGRCGVQVGGRGGARGLPQQERKQGS